LQKAPTINQNYLFESLEQKLTSFAIFYISSSLGLDIEEVNTQLIKNIHVTEISYFDPGQKIINLDNGLFQNVQGGGEIKNIDILISLDNSGFLYEILQLKSNLQFEINQRFIENITITFRGERIVNE
tara:strand:- start:297 stop:680 length:384 start_codon:yes stop_codon:yes gene_type:complete